MIAGHLTSKNGYWYCIVLIRDGNGKPKQKWISTHLKTTGNKRRAEALLMEARMHYTTIEDMRKRCHSTLFSDYLIGWVATCEGKVSMPTYNGYKNCITLKIAPYFAEKKLMLFDIRPCDLLDYYDTLYAKGLSGNTVLHYHVLIRKALQEAYYRELIPFNPADRIPRPKKDPYVANCYSPEECKQLLQALKDDPLEVPVTLTIIYGLRRSEILGLRWGSIDFERKTLTVSHSVVTASVDGHTQIVCQNKLKRKSSFRTLPLMPLAEDLLIRTSNIRYGTHKPPTNDYICLNPKGMLMTPNYLSEHLPLLMEQHKLRRIRFHDLRHSCANLLISAQVPLIEVQKWLGHSTISTTADLYSHLEYATMQRSSDSISKMLCLENTSVF